MKTLRHPRSRWWWQAFRSAAEPKWLLVAGLAVLAGCSAGKQPTAIQPTVPLVWPAPPEAPRIAYVQSIGRPADAGVKRPGFQRFAQWITGSEKGNEPLVKPFGLALDENDNLCLTDTGANAVCYLDRANRKWRRWDRIGPLRFRAPVAVAKQKDVFYVADSGLASVVAFDEAGKLRFQITNRLERPSGLAVFGDRLYVADSARHGVTVFDLAGSFVSEFGRRGNQPGEFNFPTHIAADREGNLLVTDSMNSRVQILDRDGRPRRQFGSAGDTAGHFSRPKGVAADTLGHVYVVDGMFDNLQVFDRDARLLLFLGEGGAGPGQFWLPNGIAISRRNEIFVADAYNRRVQVFQYVGPL